VDLEGAVNLRDEYERLCATPSDIVGHLPRFVDLVTVLDAQHVIELGSRSGVSTVAWLYALAGTGGRLTSVDLDRAPDIGIHEHWTHIQGDDLNPDIVASLDMADIVFIDTSHLYDQTVQELNIYRHLVRPGGVLVLHDTMLPTPEGAPPRPLYPVRKAVEEFVADNGFDWHNYPDSWGLAVIKVV
jgi:predicted O-methyltransferase YrrM